MSESTAPRRGRPPSANPRDNWHVNVDADVALFWRLQLHDELSGAVLKGSMSDLTSRLLREEMNRVIAQQQQERQGER